ncbi:uncharacterized protein LOC27207227 [Drosophila simulans]|uniref:uncharacterized protein LOC27207227 n=1 Tax=Drosophila simulans TaxID=7240 RepID=UPI00192CF3A1|nr:uncharacterized protein LOC27207227 [Drosophila simulans]
MLPQHCCQQHAPKMGNPRGELLCVWFGFVLVVPFWLPKSGPSGQAPTPPTSTPLPIPIEGNFVARVGNFVTADCFCFLSLCAMALTFVVSPHMPNVKASSIQTRKVAENTPSLL